MNFKVDNRNIETQTSGTSLLRSRTPSAALRITFVLALHCFFILAACLNSGYDSMQPIMTLGTSTVQ